MADIIFFKATGNSNDFVVFDYYITIYCVRECTSSICVWRARFPWSLEYRIRVMRRWRAGLGVLKSIVIPSFRILLHQDCVFLSSVPNELKIQSSENGSIINTLIYININWGILSSHISIRNLLWCLTRCFLVYCVWCFFFCLTTKCTI